MATAAKPLRDPGPQTGKALALGHQQQSCRAPEPSADPIVLLEKAMTKLLTADGPIPKKELIARLAKAMQNTEVVGILSPPAPRLSGHDFRAMLFSLSPMEPFRNHSMSWQTTQLSILWRTLGHRPVGNIDTSGKLAGKRKLSPRGDVDGAAKRLKQESKIVAVSLDVQNAIAKAAEMATAYVATIPTLAPIPPLQPIERINTLEFNDEHVRLQAQLDDIERQRAVIARTVAETIARDKQAQQKQLKAKIHAAQLQLAAYETELATLTLSLRRNSGL